MDEIEDYSKPTGIKALEVFKNRILQDAISYDIIEDKNILHHLNLLVEAVNRKIFNLSNPNPKEKENEKLDITSKTKKWIAIFKEGFQKLTGTEVLQKTNGMQIRQIQEAIYKLEEKGSDLETYLVYLFEDFFQNPKNITFMPPQLGFTVSNFSLEKFFVIYADIINKKKLQAQKETEINDILNRYRMLIRRNQGNAVRLQELKGLLDSYKKSEIELKELKEKIIKMEEISPI